MSEKVAVPGRTERESKQRLRSIKRQAMPSSEAPKEKSAKKPEPSKPSPRRG